MTNIFCFFNNLRTHIELDISESLTLTQPLKRKMKLREGSGFLALPIISCVVRGSFF